MGTEYLPALEGVSWSEELNQNNHLSKELQRAFKREKIDLKIIKKESDEQTKYELFQRLNTFGSSLSDQEVRNCLLIMIDKSFYEWVKSLANHNSFLEVLTITDRQFDEQYHLELLLRYLILKDVNPQDVKNIPDLSDYITREIKSIAADPSFDRATAEQEFRKTFDILYQALGDNAFRKFQGQKYTGGFSLSIYEVIALGLGKYVSNYEISCNQDLEKIKNISENLHSNPRYTSKSGTGYKASNRLPFILPLAWELFEK